MREAGLSIFDRDTHLEITLAVVDRFVVRSGWNMVIIGSRSLLITSERKLILFVPVENSANFHLVNIMLVVCFEKLRHYLFVVFAKA